jgi:hypothetical protein
MKAYSNLAESRTSAAGYRLMIEIGGSVVPRLAPGRHICRRAKKFFPAPDPPAIAPPELNL